MPDEVEAIHKLFQIYYGAFIGGNIRPLGELIARLRAKDSADDPKNGVWRSVIRKDSAKLEAALKNPACAHVRDPNSGCTPLHLCADPASARLLIRYGYDPNVPDNYGETPLHHACARLDADTAKTLLDGGASPLIKDHFGRLPADGAMMATGDPKLKSTLFNMLRIAESKAKPMKESEVHEERKIQHPPRP
jgi:hypothetical protein